jgi:hypothetical protein
MSALLIGARFRARSSHRRGYDAEPLAFGAVSGGFQPQAFGRGFAVHLLKGATQSRTLRSGGHGQVVPLILSRGLSADLVQGDWL